jgi:hypothetical protein
LISWVIMLPVVLTAAPALRSLSVRLTRDEDLPVGASQHAHDG